MQSSDILTSSIKTYFFFFIFGSWSILCVLRSSWLCVFIPSEFSLYLPFCRDRISCIQKQIAEVNTHLTVAGLFTLLFLIIQLQNRIIMDKYYRVEFTAHLHRLTLALKMNCRIEVIWKRGQKVAQSGQVALESGEANFNRKISINCNMIYETKSKNFKQKITKFAVLIYSERGTKQAGEIQFNVADYVNEKQLHKKQYEINLKNCPDKNAKLHFTISGSLKEEITADLVSQKSYSSTLQPSMLDPKSSIIEQKPKKKSQETPPIPMPKSLVPTSDKEIRNKTQGGGSIEDKIKNIEHENKKMKEQLKMKEKIKEENEELKRKLEKQDYKTINEMKKKLEEYRKENEKMKNEIRSSKDMETETNKVEQEILKCKIKIMKAFNYAAEYGGSELVDAIQGFCGIYEK